MSSAVDQVTSAGGKTITAADLRSWKPPKRTVYVPTLVEAGLTLFGAMPKWGKSYVALDLACGIAGSAPRTMADSVQVKTHAPVVYADFEAGRPIWKSRLAEILGVREWPDRLHMVDMRGLAGDEAIAVMQTEVDRVKAGLLIVDTFGRWRLQDQRTGYQADTAAMGALAAMTFARPELAVQVLTHTNQMPVSDDNWLTAFSGTNGVIGVADTLMLGTQASVRAGEGMLRFTGKNHANTDWMLEKHKSRWKVTTGPYVPPTLGDTSAAVVRAVHEAGADGFRATKDNATSLGMTPQALAPQLNRLVDGGHLARLSRGLFVHPDFPREKWGAKSAKSAKTKT